MEYLRAAAGLVFLMSIAYLLSANRKGIDWKLVGWGFFLQILFGVIVTKVEIASNAFSWVSEHFVTILNFAFEGTKFVFGRVADYPEFGFVFAFRVLPIIIFFSTLTAGLYYLGVLQVLVKGIAWVLSKFMKLSGAESLSVAGNIFLGQTEAPLLVKPFIAKMTKSELLCLMTGGMATISGASLAAYVALFGGGTSAEQASFASYLLSASIMNAPAAIVLSKMMLPEGELEKVETDLVVSSDNLGVNFLDALTKGTSDGLKMALNIGAMLISFIALIALVNYFLTAIGDITGLNTMISEATQGQYAAFTLEYVLGQLFRVFAFALGVDWNETLQVGSLLGQKMVINEFVAYVSLSDYKEAGMLSPKAMIISTYALCGFANFGSIAIQIGGIGGLAPSQQGNLAKLGMKALIAATLATMMTATLAGVLI